MFRKVLIPLPMENIPEASLYRAGELSRKFGSKVYVTYIIEDEVFDEVSKYADHVLSTKQKNELFLKLIEVHRKNAEDTIYPEVKAILDKEPTDFSVQIGKYHKVVLQTVETKDIDLIIMEYQHFSLIKFKILDRSPVPIWIERNEGPIRKIGLFCTNLAPNTMSPKVANALAKKYNAKLYPYFIQDPSGDKGLPEEIGSKFDIKWKDVKQEKFDEVLYKISKKMDFDLIILGRIRKNGYLDMRSKFAKRTRCSVLLIN